MTIEKHNPESVFQPGVYSHAVTVTGGRLLVLAGQVAWDREGNVVGDDLTTQTEQVFTNINAILAEFNADFSNVVKFTMYVVDYHPEKRSAIAQALQRHVDMSSPPANTLLGVQSLARPELLIEIDVLAAID